MEATENSESLPVVKCEKCGTEYEIFVCLPSIHAGNNVNLIAALIIDEQEIENKRQILANLAKSRGHKLSPNLSKDFSDCEFTCEVCKNEIKVSSDKLPGF
jgi:hypothetical protein